MYNFFLLHLYNRRLVFYRNNFNLLQGSAENPIVNHDLSVGNSPRCLSSFIPSRKRISRGNHARESSIVRGDRSCRARCWSASILRDRHRKSTSLRRESREIMKVQAPIRGIRVVVNKTSYRRQSKREGERKRWYSRG